MKNILLFLATSCISCHLMASQAPQESEQAIASTIKTIIQSDRKEAAESLPRLIDKLSPYKSAKLAAAYPKTSLAEIRYAFKLTNSDRRVRVNNEFGNYTESEQRAAYFAQILESEEN